MTEFGIEMYMYLVDGCLSFGNADGVGADSRGSRRSVRVGGQLSSRVSC